MPDAAPPVPAAAGRARSGMRGLAALRRAWVVVPVCALALALALALPVTASAQPAPGATSAPHPREDPESRSGRGPQTAAVVIDGQTLFRLIGTTALPAARRAQLVADRIEALARDPSKDPTALRVQDTDASTEIWHGDQRLVVIFDDDASIEGIASRGPLAIAYVDRIQRAVLDYRAERTTDALLRGAGVVAGATVALALALFALRRLRRWARTHLEARLDERLHDLRVQDVPVVHATQIAATVRVALRVFWTLVWLALLFAYLEYALSRFVWTRPFAERTVALVFDPLRTMRDGLLDALPGLMFVAVLGMLVYWLIRAGQAFFDAVASGAVKLAGFEAEWAVPTFRILRTLVLLFALVIAYPYLPGSGSDAFKGISVFIGVMLSLGAASMIGNLLAGYTMIYRRAFRVGDRIKVGEHIGDVMHIRAMVTHLRTPKNEEVVVPNSRLLGEQVVNYSSLARTEGLILHTTVGIGYETPWRQVEAMLLLAAGRTAGVKAEPAPFVLQKSLGDFCVVYEINVYVDSAQGMNRVYSELHRQILDVFNEFGVQIMTPAYVNDTPDPKLVPPSRWYAAPARGPASPGASGASGASGAPRGARG